MLNILLKKMYLETFLINQTKMQSQSLDYFKKCRNFQNNAQNEKVK